MLTRILKATLAALLLRRPGNGASTKALSVRKDVLSIKKHRYSGKNVCTPKRLGQAGRICTTRNVLLSGNCPNWLFTICAKLLFTQYDFKRGLGVSAQYMLPLG